ncbi:hypothetical protein V1273_005676 [Bradyrhizobium sp. AZCC 1721]
MGSSLRVVAFSVLLIFCSSSSRSQEDDRSESFVVFRKDENDFAQSWMESLFSYYKNYIARYDSYRTAVELTEVKVDFTSDYSVYSTKENGKYVIRVSTGLYRLMMNLSIVRLSELDIKIKTAQCIRGYFADSSKFLRPVPGLPPNALMPRIDKYLTATCPEIAQALRPVGSGPFEPLGEEMAPWVGFILLHEIGHIVLGHFEKRFDPQQELDADAFATIHSMHTQKQDYNKVLGRQLLYFTLVPSSAHSLNRGGADSISSGQRFAQTMQSCIDYTVWIKDEALGLKIKKSFTEAFRHFEQMGLITLPRPK